MGASRGAGAWGVQGVGPSGPGEGRGGGAAGRRGGGAAGGARTGAGGGDSGSCSVTGPGCTEIPESATSFQPAQPCECPRVSGGRGPGRGRARRFRCLLDRRRPVGPGAAAESQLTQFPGPRRRRVFPPLPSGHRGRSFAQKNRRPRACRACQALPPSHRWASAAGARGSGGPGLGLRRTPTPRKGLTWEGGGGDLACRQPLR